MRKRIIVTGAAGRIGQAFIKAHRERFDITGFDQKPTPNVDRSVTANLTDLEALVNAAQGCVAMVHLGAHPNQHLDYPGMIVTNNVVGTYNAFEAAARAGVHRVVFASTVQTEFGWGEGVKVSVTMPARPTNVYAASKVWGEHLGFLYSRDRGVSVICLRLGGVVPSEQEDALIESGEEPADIALFSRDVVEILKRAVEVEGVPYAVVPAYSINAVAIKDLEPLRQVLGFTPELEPRLAARSTAEGARAAEFRRQSREFLAAAGRGEEESVRKLLAADSRLADVTGRGPEWEDRKVRPLHLAARQGHLGVLRLLLDAGSDPRAAGGRHGWTPALYAAVGGHPAAVELLLTRGAERDVFVESALGDIAGLRARLDRDPACLNAATSTGVTPLHVAGSAEMVQLLLDCGADPDRRDDWRRSPLTWSLGKPAVARALAERMGALNIFYAASVGDSALARTLLDADPALANAETPPVGQFWPGRRALHMAVMRGHLKVIRELLAHGADPNAVDSEGATPLHVAAWHGQDEVIRLLVESGARLFAGDTEWSASPREWAEHAGKTGTAALLQELEAAHPVPAAAAVTNPIRRVLVTGAASAAARAFRSAADACQLVTVEGADPGELAHAITGCDAVVHLGSAPRDAAFAALVQEDILRLWQVLEAARQAGVRRFIFGSTQEVYGGWPPGTTPDSETTPLRPGSLWAAVQALNENICIAYGKRLQSAVVSVRLDGKDDGTKLLEALERDKGRK